MRGSEAADARERVIRWVEEGITWMEEGRSLMGLLQELLAASEPLRGEAQADLQDSEELSQESGEPVREQEEIIEVAPEGDLDLASATEMRLQDHLDAGRTRIVLDLGGIAYIDSAGLGEVVRAMKRARAAGGDLRICGLNGEVLGIFEITGLSKAMAIYPTREEAVASWGWQAGNTPPVDESPGGRNERPTSAGAVAYRRIEPLRS